MSCTPQEAGAVRQGSPDPEKEVPMKKRKSTKSVRRVRHPITRRRALGTLAAGAGAATNDCETSGTKSGVSFRFTADQPREADDLAAC